MQGTGGPMRKRRVCQWRREKEKQRGDTEQAEEWRRKRRRRRI